MDLPADLPPPIDPPAALVQRCITHAARGYDVHPFIVASIVEVEGGRIGTISRNSNGTYDLGIMQINTINLPSIQRRFPGVTWQELAYSPCINIGVGTWFLSERIQEARGDVWRGVGNYHSRTPTHHNRYLGKVRTAFQKLVRRYRVMTARRGYD